MSIVIPGKTKKYTFDGLFNEPKALENKVGVFAIVRKKGEKHEILDVGQTPVVRDHVTARTSTTETLRTEVNTGNLRYAVMYTPDLKDEGRAKIEQDIREKFTPMPAVLN
jgi:hypothetical protein